VQTAENPAEAVDQTQASWRERANAELEKIIKLFSSAQLPDLCAKALINAPEKPSSKWSFGNQILMLLAGTSDARGFRQWNEVGRYVRKGAKAFRILGPVFVKKRLESTDPNDDEEIEVLVGFRAIPVFRFEETEGAELPIYKPRDPPPLLEVAEKFGMKVNYLRLSAGVLGMTDYERQVITLATEDWTTFSTSSHTPFTGPTSRRQITARNPKQKPSPSSSQRLSPGSTAGLTTPSHGRTWPAKPGPTARARSAPCAFES